MGRRCIRQAVTFVAAVAAAGALAACSAGAHGVGSRSGLTPVTGAAPAARLALAEARGVGRVLVDGAGMTLYLFEPDHQGRPTCQGLCLSEWPPLTLAAGDPLPTAGTGVQGRLIGAVALPDGRRQVTYGGWPLYLWVGDSSPGDANGEGVVNFGGPWYVVSGDGQAEQVHTGL